MSATFKETDRHIFPRWRSFVATNELGELALPAISADNDTSRLDLSLAEGIANWEAEPSLWQGLDLLGAAIVAGKLEEFPDLVAEITRNPLAPEIARRFLQRNAKPEQTTHLSPENQEPTDLLAQAEIRKRKLQLAFAPRDAIEWVELARAYTIAGVNDKARRAILAALQLAPDNRFVLRCAARFFIHVGEKERAYSLLGRSRIIKSDPWVMASEIAIADSLGKTSKSLRLAKEKIEADIPPSELTELFSAMATMEAESGNHRGARRLLRRALIDPNENSIAQIRWLNRSHLGDVVDVSNANPPLLHEASAWDNFYKGEFEVARDESLRWLQDQPFASAPAILSTYILADIFNDWTNGKLLSQAALKSNPDDRMLLNNLSVCLMELGDLAAAEQIVTRLRTESGNNTKQEAIFNATSGMLEFRKGNVQQGRHLYLKAIQAAKDLNLKETAARAAVHLLLEEIIAETEFIQEAVARVGDFGDLQHFREIRPVQDRVTSHMREG